MTTLTTSTRQSFGKRLRYKSEILAQPHEFYRSPEGVVLYPLADGEERRKAADLNPRASRARTRR